MNEWSKWVSEEMAEDIVKLFGGFLALTVLFGPTAGVLIDLITAKLKLKVLFIHS